MGVIERSDLDRVAMAHRAYCQSVPMMPWMRLSDEEYETIIRAAQPRGAVETLERIADGYPGESRDVAVVDDWYRAQADTALGNLKRGQ
jgi:hypothetical protein